MSDKTFVDDPEFILIIKNELSLMKECIVYIETKLNEINGIQNMIKKYYNFMKNINDCDNIMNDYDIKLIWYIHLLHPHIYRNDSLYYFNKIITPQNIHLNKNLKTKYNNKNITNMDLKKSLLGQYQFMKKLVKRDMIHASNMEIKKWIHNYKLFMNKIGSCNEIIVPTLGIDMIWHTHMIYHNKYYNDSIILSNGKFVNHNDDLDEQFLKKQFNITIDLLNLNKNDYKGDESAHYYSINSIIKAFVILVSILLLSLHVYNNNYHKMFVNIDRRQLMELSSKKLDNIIIFGSVVGGIIILMCLYYILTRTNACIIQDMEEELKSFKGSLDERNNKKYQICQDVNMGCINCGKNFKELVDAAYLSVLNEECRVIQSEAQELLMKIPNVIDRRHQVEQWTQEGFDTGSHEANALHFYKKIGRYPINCAFSQTNKNFDEQEMKEIYSYLGIYSDKGKQLLTSTEMNYFKQKVIILKETNQYTERLINELYNNVMYYNTVVADIQYTSKASEWKSYTEIISEKFRNMNKNISIDEIINEIKPEMDHVFQGIYKYIKYDKIGNKDTVCDKLLIKNKSKHKILLVNDSIMDHAFECKEFYEKSRYEYWQNPPSRHVRHYGGNPGYGGCGGGGC